MDGAAGPTAAADAPPATAVAAAGDEKVPELVYVRTVLPSQHVKQVAGTIRFRTRRGAPAAVMKPGSGTQRSRHGSRLLHAPSDRADVAPVHAVVRVRCLAGEEQCRGRSPVS